MWVEDFEWGVHCKEIAPRKFYYTVPEFYVCVDNALCDLGSCVNGKFFGWWMEGKKEGSPNDLLLICSFYRELGWLQHIQGWMNGWDDCFVSTQHGEPWRKQGQSGFMIAVSKFVSYMTELVKKILIEHVKCGICWEATNLFLSSSSFSFLG